MKMGIIGLPESGKSTIFGALTQNVLDAERKRDGRLRTVWVLDKRLKALSNIYKPKRTICAHVEYLLPGMLCHKKEGSRYQNIWNQARDSDALIHVVRNFGNPAPYSDFFKLDQEMILADLITVEKRLEHIELNKKRGKRIDLDETLLLNECLKNLENGISLRKCPDLASAHPLKGFAFISAKPMLVLFNNEDEDDNLPDVKNSTFKEDCMVVRGKLEQELAQMSDEDAKEFLSEFSIAESAMERVIKRSCELLGLIFFFTVIKDEVKAWTIKKGTKTVDAAGVIHSDIKKGFIRAEMVSYENLMDAGTYQEAKKRGAVRLEGKTYEIQDGDIVKFLFNV